MAKIGKSRVMKAASAENIEHYLAKLKNWSSVVPLISAPTQSRVNCKLTDTGT